MVTSSGDGKVEEMSESGQKEWKSSYKINRLCVGMTRVNSVCVCSVLTNSNWSLLRLLALADRFVTPEPPGKPIVNNEYVWEKAELKWGPLGWESCWHPLKAWGHFCVRSWDPGLQTRLPIEHIQNTDPRAFSPSNRIFI